MEMKKLACAILVAAAVSTSVATAGTASEAPAPDAVPISDAFAALPVVGSFVGATILSFFALYA
ncbi:hypothetical protein CDL12_28197 [Handroanthus impetiginosus]|uniref:Arabinogalactan peptide 23-like n=1 Tax=Handroanthus impetiginosus TaxID=429701 RepID=A0A2G9G1X5_9LAMI|nr:hypothetical protein CDL12_28197 [Handroanthus impetiginosus]